MAIKIKTVPVVESDGKIDWNKVKNFSALIDARIASVTNCANGYGGTLSVSASTVAGIASLTFAQTGGACECECQCDCGCGDCSG